ncbi:MAG: YihY/virulence factor BrkB family protein [Deltaproteobacteria bacterium]
MKKGRWVMLVLEFYGRFQSHEIPALGAQMSYYLILAFFPFIIFLLTLLSFTPLTGDLALYDLSRLIPASAYDLVQDVVAQTMATRRHTLLSFGLLFTLWSAVTGVNALIRGVNKAYSERESRSFWKHTGISITFTTGLVLVIILALTLLVAGKQLGSMFFSYLGVTELFHLSWDLFRYLVPLSVMFLVFILFYRYAPNRKTSWQQVIPGSLFSTLGWVGTSWGFAYYVNHFANYSRTYGSLGAFIVLLLWLYLSSMIILLGAEINAVLENREWARPQEGKGR